LESLLRVVASKTGALIKHSVSATGTVLFTLAFGPKPSQSSPAVPAQSVQDQFNDLKTSIQTALRDKKYDDIDLYVEDLIVLTQSLLTVQEKLVQAQLSATQQAKVTEDIRSSNANLTEKNNLLESLIPIVQKRTFDLFL
jgi:hypothetical protein